MFLQDLIGAFRTRCGRYYYYHEYWMKLDNIKVDFERCEENVNRSHLREEINYFYNTGFYKTRVLIDKDFELVDGYITYLVAEKLGASWIPVIFINPWEWKFYGEDEINKRANHGNDEKHKKK